MSDSRSSQRTGPVASGRGSSTKYTIGTVGSSHGPVSEDELTVISTRAPLPDLPLARQLQPSEIGKLLEGEQLGQFILQQFVGGGGMGAVFRALDTTLNREVAVKVLSRDQSGDEEMLRRFKNEAQSAARLDHDNIARVHYVGEDRGVHYIVFEFIEGVNIRDLVLERGSLSLTEAISYTLQVAEALAHASQRDVIHRDIKPSNVLITPDGKAKLVDMGLARLHQVEHDDNDLTASGVTLGTFDYISPEQARDPRSADVRSDLYSLGCSLFYMLTGRPPFPEGTVLQKLLQHQADEPPDAREFRPDLPSGVTRILTKLLAKMPDQRYQLPGDLIGELVVVGEGLGMPALASSLGVRTSVATPKDTFWADHLPWIVPVAALVLIVVALDVYWSIENGDSPVTEQATGAQEVKAARAALLPTIASRPADPANESTTNKNSTARAKGEAAQGKDNASKQPATKAASNASAGKAANVTSRSTPLPEEATEAAASEPKATIKSGDNPDAASPVRPTAASQASDAATAETDAAESDGAATDASKTPAAISATGAQATTTSATADAAASENTAKLLIVTEGDEGPRSFATLQAACNAAETGDVIELRYNGRHEERPVSLANVTVTIRPGAQFKPVVVFRPADSQQYSGAMITVVGGKLTLSGVHVELDVLPDVVRSEGWAMFETREAELVRLQDCTLTILNGAAGQSAYQPGVVFFDIKEVPGSDLIPMDPGAGDLPQFDPQRVLIELQNCLVRGEATFLRSLDMQSWRLDWQNGLLLTSERMLLVGGSPSAPAQLATVDVDLRHVTAVARGGLAMFTGANDARLRVSAQFRVADSILVGRETSALVEHRDVDNLDELRNRLTWQADHVFYEGFDIYWQISSPLSSREPKRGGFAAWQSYWGPEREKVSQQNAVQWKSDIDTRTQLHAQTAADFALSPESTNAAVGGGSDSLDAGCLLNLLPSLPPAEGAAAGRPRSSGTSVKPAATPAAPDSTIPPATDSP